MFSSPRRARVYDALTIAAQFDKVSKLGKAARTMNLPKGETRIYTIPGGVFSIFGGFISGRQIELVPGRRIVQAWREAVWDAGVYSLVRFELSDDGAGTKLAFDQSGFPKGAGAGLAEGWTNDYWTPLQQFLA
jgi:activator of HSP90 ATPase